MTNLNSNTSFRGIFFRSSNLMSNEGRRKKSRSEVADLTRIGRGVLLESFSYWKAVVVLIGSYFALPSCFRLTMFGIPLRRDFILDLILSRSETNFAKSGTSRHEFYDNPETR